METTYINGQLYDWSAVQVQLPGGVAIGISSIDYDDELPTEERYGKGRVARGSGTKNYKASAKMELDLDEDERFRRAMGGSVYNGTFPIIVSYATDGLPIVTDVLPVCRVTKISTGNKQGDDNAGARKYDLKVLSPIHWGGTPAVTR